MRLTSSASANGAVREFRVTAVLPVGEDSRGAPSSSSGLQSSSLLNVATAALCAVCAVGAMMLIYQLTLSFSYQVALAAALCATVAIAVSIASGTVVEESLLVVRDLGLQVSTRYLLGRTHSRFIDRANIADLVIAEGIVLFQVRFYLCIIVKGQSQTEVVFQHLLPRFDILIQVYRGARALLYNEAEFDE